MNNDFLIVKNMKVFINDINKILINYPRCEYVIKNKIEETSLDILEYIYYANNIKELDKKNDIRKLILAKISMLDYYLEYSFKKRYITEKLLYKKSQQLDTITKLLYGWLRSDNKCL